MTFCSCVMVGPSFAPPVVRSTRLRLAPLTTGNDAHHFVNSVRSSPNFHMLFAFLRLGSCCSVIASSLWGQRYGVRLNTGLRVGFPELTSDICVVRSWSRSNEPSCPP